MRIRLAALLGVIFIIATLPANAASPDERPVRVDDCSKNGARMTLDVTFANVSQKTISNVRFAVTTRNGVIDMKDDAGSFAPGDRVTHHLRVKDDYLLMWAKTGCEVAGVTFQDGSMWENSSMPPDMVRALPQTPGSNIALSRCYTAAGVHINFTNTAAQDATQVVLGVVQSGKLVWTDTDTGTFSPHVLIERGWDGDGPYKGQIVKGYAVATDLLQQSCTVLSVTYADGTTWKNPAPPPLALDGLTFEPPAPQPEDAVSISGCDGSSSSYYGAGDWRLNYTNATKKPIVATDFALFMHGKLLAIAQDLHTLAPGDGSRARFPLIEPNFRQPTCVVVNVEFNDGTRWLNPAFAQK